MTSSEHRPYVVSADIEGLLQAWASRSGFVVPSGDFVARLRAQFCAYVSTIFSEFTMICEEDLRRTTNDILRGASLPVVNLDGALIASKYRYELCRVSDARFRDAGVRHRVGAPCIESQLAILKRELKGDAVLYDDIIFSGKTIADVVIPTLEEAGIYIRAVYAAVGIRAGMKRIAQLVDTVQCGYSYDNVVDQVCERDFYLGVPFSGRELVDGNNVGMSYVAPFGDPVGWASIPKERVDDFSEFCIRQSISLFKEIERCSSRAVRCVDVPRKVPKLPSGSERFVDELEKYLTC